MPEEDESVANMSSMIGEQVRSFFPPEPGFSTSRSLLHVLHTHTLGVVDTQFWRSASLCLLTRVTAL